MKVDADTKQRFATFFTMCLEFYKVIMGTFLVVFVPQQCNDNICTMRENFFNGGILNTAGSICNFVTFTSIGTLYFIELKRENWCIQYLDIDDTKSTNNLDTEIELYPKYKNQMAILNKHYIRSVYVALFMMLTNFVLSGVTVYQSYAGTNSITTFLSFFMLVFMKLYSSWTVGALSIKDERANSAYMKEPKTYNTIDADYRLADITNEPTIEEIITQNPEEESKGETKEIEVEMKTL